LLQIYYFIFTQIISYIYIYIYIYKHLVYKIRKTSSLKKQETFQSSKDIFDCYKNNFNQFKSDLVIQFTILLYFTNKIYNI